MKMTQNEKNAQGLHRCKFFIHKEHDKGGPTVSIEEFEELIGTDPIFFTLSDITYIEDTVEEVRI